MIAYVDNILLLAPSVACDEELNSIDMVINFLKNPAVCVLAIDMIIMCAKIIMCDGGELPWVDEIGVVIIRGAKFKCSIDLAKRPFYRAANGIFAKIVDWLLRKLWFNF